MDSAKSSNLKKSLVIIDTDPGIDDVVALLLALASPELEILAFITSFGNTDVHHSQENMLKLHDVLLEHQSKHPERGNQFPGVSPERCKPFLARGEDGPLEGDLHSAQYFHGRDGLGGISERHPEIRFTPFDNQDHPYYQSTEKSGADLALELIRTHPERSITYIALGPLTTFAQMLRKDATLVQERLWRVVAMGGALDVPGNTSPVAEFNFFADPYAVAEVLTPTDISGLIRDRFLLFPLDITTPHELPFPTYKDRVDPTFESTQAPSLATDGKSPLVHFTSSFLERTREVMLEFGKDAMELHDLLPIWFVIKHPHPSTNTELDFPFRNFAPEWNSVRRKFQVERTGEHTRGMLVVDRRDDNFSPLGANRAAVQVAIEAASLAYAQPIVVPARVEVETREEAEKALKGLHDRELKASDVKADTDGIMCVVHTPGPRALLTLLLLRVWGVKVGE